MSASNVSIGVLHWQQYIPYSESGVISTVDSENNRTDYPFITVEAFSFKSRLAQAIKVEKESPSIQSLEFSANDTQSDYVDAFFNQESSSDNQLTEQEPEVIPVLPVNHEQLIEPVKGKTHAREIAHRIRNQADTIVESTNGLKEKLGAKIITPENLLEVSSHLAHATHLKEQLSTLYLAINARPHLLPVKHGNVKQRVNDIVSVDELDSLVGELTQLKAQITSELAAQESELQESITIANAMLDQQADEILNRGMGVAEKYVQINRSIYHKKTSISLLKKLG